MEVYILSVYHFYVSLSCQYPRLTLDGGDRGKLVNSTTHALNAATDKQMRLCKLGYYVDQRATFQK